jgi:hypothetical protein
MLFFFVAFAAGAPARFDETFNPHGYCMDVRIRSRLRQVTCAIEAKG